MDESIDRRRTAIRLARTSSMPRLFPNIAKTVASSLGGSSSWNDSTSNLTMGSSLDSIQENEFAGLALIKDIDQAIAHQATQKKTLEKRIENISCLAMARYECGNPAGALLSLRKLHRNRNRKAYIVAAKYQLTQLRQQVRAEMNSSRFDYLDVAVLRDTAKGIIVKARAVDQLPAPPDNDLLAELYKMLRMAEI